MAIYTFTLIDESNLGNTDVTIEQVSEGTSLNQFIATISEAEYYFIRSLNLVSDCLNQLRQPVTISRNDIDGGTNENIITPPIDIYQVQPVIYNFKTDIIFDFNTKIKFKLKAGCYIRLTLNIDENLYNETSKTQLLNKNKDSVLDDIMMDFDPELENIIVKELKESPYLEKEELEDKQFEAKVQKGFKEKEEISKEKKKPVIKIFDYEVSFGMDKIFLISFLMYSGFRLIKKKK